MKRIFIGSKINIDSKKYEEIINDFNNVIFGKWVEQHNLHLTFKFIGDIEEKYIPIIKGLLIDELKEHNVSITLLGLGFFPRITNPKVLYLALKEKNNKIYHFQNIISSKLKEVGIIDDNKPFKSHITLCRIKNSENYLLQDIYDRYKEYFFQEIDKIEINIFESKLTKTGPIYTVL